MLFCFFPAARRWAFRGTNRNRAVNPSSNSSKTHDAPAPLKKQKRKIISSSHSIKQGKPRWGFTKSSQQLSLFFLPQNLPAKIPLPCPKSFHLFLTRPQCFLTAAGLPKMNSSYVFTFSRFTPPSNSTHNSQLPQNALKFLAKNPPFMLFIPPYARGPRIRHHRRTPPLFCLCGEKPQTSPRATG